MKKGIYAVKDVLSGFCDVFNSVSDPLARRDFGSVASDRNTQIGRNPGDFELWRVGVLDTDSGLIESDMELICRAVEFRKE